MAHATEPSTATIAFREKVAKEAQHSKYIDRLSKNEQRVIRAGLDAYKKPKAGDPRKRVYLAIKAKAKEVKAPSVQLHLLALLAGIILDQAFSAAQKSKGSQEKTSNKVVSIKRDKEKPSDGSHKASAS